MSTHSNRQQSKSQPLHQLASDPKMQSQAPPELVLQATADTNTPAAEAPINPQHHLSAEDMAGYGPRQEGPIAIDSGWDGQAMSPNDVSQGGIGNCFLMAGLMALAQQRPEVLENAITGPDGQGNYRVRLFRNAGFENDNQLVPEDIVVEPTFITNADYFMVMGERYDMDGGGEYTYAREGDRDEEGNPELWVQLIEKAYAILVMEKGGFNWMHQGGFGVEALEALTGEQHTEYQFSGQYDEDYPSNELNPGIMPEQELKDLVIGYLADGEALTASTYLSGKFNDANRQFDGFFTQNNMME